MNALAKFRALNASSFVRSVGVLVGGTAFAQVILGLTLPVATRLYSPEDFSLLAVFTGLVSIISVAVCLRLEVAIPLPEQDIEAANVLGAASLAAMSITALLIVSTLAAGEWLAGSLGQPALASYLWLIPVAALLAGFYSTLQFWFVRKKRFGTIARNRVAQAAGSSATQLGLGLLGIAPLGLILGQTVNSGLGAIRLAYQALVTDFDVLRGISRAGMIEAVAKYERFPRYSTLEALSNSAAIYLPIVMLGSLAAGPEAGFLMLGMYAMQVPMGLIGNAVSQVYMSRGADEYRDGRLGQFTTDVLGGLIKTGVGPLCVIGIVAPDLFEIVFGAEWRRAGLLVSWMTPWFIMQFLASPISLALHIANRLGTALLLQVFGLVLRTGAVYGALWIAERPLSEAYALSGAVFYFAYLVVVLSASHSRPADVISALRSGVLPFILWCGAGWIGSLAVATFRNALL